MADLFSLASSNLTSPIILCFALGLAAAMARSDLSVPEAVAKGLSIYLLFAIGVKGGVSVSSYGFSSSLVAALVAGALLSAALPLLAFALLRFFVKLDRLNAAAVAGHYGSISIVTFVAASSVLESQGLDAEGYLVAVAAIMEAPAILSALWLVARGSDSGKQNAGSRMDNSLWREILLNGSIVLLIGSFIVGIIAGEDGMAEIESFIVSPFKGVLCLFMLDMGLVAGRSLLQSGRLVSARLVAFGILMPVLGACIAVPVTLMLGLSTGGAALLMVLCASASYIAVPAAMRVALPEANPGIYLTASLGITFPFNLVVGIPLYLAIAETIIG
jgi:hypothetical protein